MTRKFLSSRALPKGSRALPIASRGTMTRKFLSLKVMSKAAGGNWRNARTGLRTGLQLTSTHLEKIKIISWCTCTKEAGKSWLTLDWKLSAKTVAWILEQESSRLLNQAYIPSQFMVPQVLRAKFWAKLSSGTMGTKWREDRATVNPPSLHLHSSSFPNRTEFGSLLLVAFVQCLEDTSISRECSSHMSEWTNWPKPRSHGVSKV